jgi:hypothetical protein
MVVVMVVVVPAATTTTYIGRTGGKDYYGVRVDDGGNSICIC